MSRTGPRHRLPGMAARTKPAAGATKTKKSTRLTLDDWVDAAFDLLVREGASGVKITRLCEELGVTKGSFYWHFDDIDALMTTIADRWCDAQNDTARGLGFDAEEGRLRAGALVYAGIGFVHSRGSLPTPTLEEVRATFDLLTTGTAAPSS